MRDDIPQESDRTQAFIAARQFEVLDRARDVVRTTPRGELASAVHRLAGTLGTYQLPEAYDDLRYLEAIVQRTDATDDDVERARADTLATLDEVAAGLMAADEVPNP